MVQIRKRKNEEFIERKRQKLTGDDGRNDALDPIFQQDNLQIIEYFNTLTASFYEYFKARDFENLAQVAEKIRRAVSRDEKPPLQQLINTGIVSHIIQLLDYDYFQYEVLMNECAWIIANIASGAEHHVKFLIDNQIVFYAINMLDHPNENVKDNAVWILSNVAGDSLEGGDSLIEKEIVGRIEKLLDGHSYQTNFIAHVSWLISNLTRGKPYPEYREVEPFIPILQFFIENVQSDEVVNNCMWALSYLSDGTDAQIKAVLDMGITDKIVQMLAHDEPHMVAPALRVVGNLVTGGDSLTDQLIEKHVIPPLAMLLSSPKKIFRKEATWAISNIMAGPAYQIEEIFHYNDREILKKLFQMAATEDLEIRRECVFCITNACSDGTLQQIQVLVEFEIIQLIVETLQNNNDPVVTKGGLEALETILNYGKDIAHASQLGKNPFVIKLAQAQGLQVVESLQSHPENEIYEIVSRIIDEHLDFE